MRADFYLIAKPRFLEAPLNLVCELAKRAYASNQPTLILARDAAQAEELAGGIPGARRETITSLHGHDGFLIETAAVGHHLRRLLAA